MSLNVPMRQHPDSTCDFLTDFHVEVQRTPRRRLALRFEMRGKVRHMASPRWNGTEWIGPTCCYAALLRVKGEPAFYEFSLAPHRGSKAVFHPAGGGPTRQLPKLPPPEVYWGTKWPEGGTISMPRQERRNLYRHALSFTMALDLDLLVALPLELPWQLAIGAVIRDNHGRESWWSLAHPPGAPDFHHPDSFVLELPAARPYREHGGRG